MSKFFRVAELKIKIRKGDFSGFISEIDIKNLRIAFQITKNLSWSTNKASIQVWNLSNEKRDKIKDYGDEINLLAGYREESGVQILFIGDTSKVSHSYDFPEIVSRIECGDGEKSINQKRISISYGAKTPAKEVLLQIAQKLGLDNVYITNDVTNIVYEQGYQFVAFGKEALDIVSKNLGLTWSIQNGDLYIIKRFGTTAKAPVNFNQSTGMVGVPERYTYKRLNLWTDAPKQGWKVRTLLRPDVLPGDKVRLDSTKVDGNGLYYVDTVRHTGDTDGNEWFSNWELIRV